MPGAFKRKKVKAFDPFASDKAKRNAYYASSKAGGANMPVTKKSQQMSWTERQFAASIRAADPNAKLHVKPNKQRPNTPQRLPQPKDDADDEGAGCQQKEPKRNAKANAGGDDDDADAGSDDDAPRAKRRKTGAAAADTSARDADDNDAKIAANRHAKDAAIPKFKSKIRDGESFQSYQQRIVAEKHEYLLAEQKRSAQKAISATRKEYLSRKKDRLKPRGEETEFTTHDGTVRPIKNFAGAETIAFGDVADRPPIFTVLPKQKQKVPGVVALAAELKQLDEADDGAAGGAGAGAGGFKPSAAATAISLSAPQTIGSKIAPVLSSKNKKKKKPKAQRNGDGDDDDDGTGSGSGIGGSDSGAAIRTLPRQPQPQRSSKATTGLDRNTSRLRDEAMAAYKQSKANARSATLHAAGVAQGVTAAQREREADATRKTRVANTAAHNAAFGLVADPELADEAERAALRAAGKGKRSVAGALAMAIKSKARNSDGSALLSNL